MPHQHVDTLPQLDELTHAEARIHDTLATLTDEQAAYPSLLPGWSRAHVIAHLARNADGMRNLLTWARTGVETPMYASAAQRAADIEAGARLPARQLRQDLRAATRQLDEALRTLPHGRWQQQVALINGTQLPAAELVWHRLKEVQIHHVDLHLGHAPHDWDRSFRTCLLTEILDIWRRRGEAPALRLVLTDESREVLTATADEQAPEISGSSAEILAWLIGRSAATNLPRLSPAGALPQLPQWA